MPKAITIYDNQSKKYLKYGYGADDDNGDLESGIKIYNQLRDAYGDRISIKTDDLPYTNDIEDSLQLDTLGSQSRADALSNPETVDPEQTRLAQEGEKKFEFNNQVYSQLDNKIEDFRSKKGNDTGSSLLKEFKKQYEIAKQSGDDQLASVINQKFYDVFGTDYDINMITDVEGLPTSVRAKPFGQRTLEAIFTTAPFEESEYGNFGSAGINAITGILDLPARIVGKIAGKGDLSDEDTKILRDQIQENREELAKTLANDEGFQKYAKATGRVVVELALQILSNPVDAVTIMKSILKGGASALGKTSKAEESLRARLLKRGYQTPDATIEQWVRQRPNFFNNIKPTQEQLEEIKGVFKIVDDVEAKNIYQKMKSTSDEGSLAGAIRDILDNKMGSEYTLGSGRSPVQFPSDIERQKYMQQVEGAVVDYGDDVTEEMLGAKNDFKFLEEIKGARNSVDSELEGLRREIRQAKLDLANERLGQSAKKQNVSIDNMENSLDDIQKRLDGIGEYGAKKQLSSNKQAIRDNLKQIKDDVSAKRKEIKALKNKQSIQKFEGNKIASNKTRGEVLQKEKEMFNETDLERNVNLANREIEADNLKLQENIDSAIKDKMQKTVDIKKEKIEIAKNSKIQEMRENIQNLINQESSMVEKGRLETLLEGVPSSNKMTIEDADNARKEINRYLNEVGYYDGNSSVKQYKDLDRFATNLRDNIKRTVIRSLDEDEAKSFISSWDKYVEDTKSMAKAKKLLKVQPTDLPEEISTKINSAIDTYLKSGGTKGIKDTESFVSGLNELGKIYDVDFVDILDRAVDASKSLKTGWRGDLYVKTAKDVGRRSEKGGDLSTKILGGMADGVKNTLKYMGIGAVTTAEQMTGQQIKFLDEWLHLSDGAFITDKMIANGPIATTAYALDKMLKSTGSLPKSLSKYEVVKSMLRGIEASDDALKLDYDDDAKQLLTKQYPELKNHFDKYFDEESGMMILDGKKRGVSNYAKTEIPNSFIEKRKNKINGYIDEFFSSKGIDPETAREVINSSAKEAIDYAIEKSGFKNNTDAFKKLGIKVSDGVSDLDSVDKISVVMAPYMKAIFDSVGGDMVVTSGYRENSPEGSGHKKGKSIDIRGQSSGGKSFHKDVKLKRVSEGVYEPFDQKTKDIIKNIENKLKAIKGVKTANFEYGDPKTFDPKQFAPHFHIEFEDIGASKSNVNVIADLLGYKVNLGTEIDTFGGDNGRELKVKDVKIEKGE